MFKLNVTAIQVAKFGAFVLSMHEDILGGVFLLRQPGPFTYLRGTAITKLLTP